MKRTTRHGAIVLSTLVMSVFIVLTGCGSSALTPAGSDGVQQDDSVAEMTADQRSEQALQHYVTGSMYESQGRYGDAITEFSEALRFDPNPAIYSTIVRNYLALRQPHPALGYARRAVELSPGDRAARKQLAELYVTLEQPDSAAAQYTMVLASDPEDTDALFALAHLLRSTDPERALTLYQSVIDRSGADWEVLFGIAETYLSLGRKDEAIDTLERMRRLDGTNRELLQTLGALYIETGRSDEAISVYHDLVERIPAALDAGIAAAGALRDTKGWLSASNLLGTLLRIDSIGADGCMQVADAYFRHTLSDSTADNEALQVFNNLRRRFPDDWRPVWYIGATHYNRGQMADAVLAMRSVTTLNPANTEAFDVLARALLSMDDVAGAIGPLETVVSRNAATADTYAFLGFAYHRLGKDSLAIDALNHALAFDPERLDVIGTLALTYDGRKEYAKSDTLYERAFRSFPDTSSSQDAAYYLLLNNYAFTLSERGVQLDRALSMAKRSVEFDPENSSYLDTIGWIYFQIGQYVPALDFISHAVRLRERDGKSAGPVLNAHLGDVYHALGRISDALRFWRKALSEDPANSILAEKIRQASK